MVLLVKNIGHDVPSTNVSVACGLGASDSSVCARLALQLSQTERSRRLLCPHARVTRGVASFVENREHALFVCKRRTGKFGSLGALPVLSRSAGRAGVMFKYDVRSITEYSPTGVG